jgi:hypothetical protein
MELLHRCSGPKSDQTSTFPKFQKRENEQLHDWGVQSVPKAHSFARFHVRPVPVGISLIVTSRFRLTKRGLSKGSDTLCSWANSSQRRNIPASWNPANEGRRVLGDKALDPWKRIYEGSSHFRPVELAGGQYKSPDSRWRKRRSFSDSVADPIILGEHDPAAFADFGEPVFIFSVRGEVVIVDLDGLADFPQRLSDDLFTKGTVDETN